MTSYDTGSPDESGPGFVPMMAENVRSLMPMLPTAPLRMPPPVVDIDPAKEDAAARMAGAFRMIGDTIVELAERIRQMPWEELTKVAQEAAAAKARWEIEHPGVPYDTGCYCLCGLWKHTGICAGYAQLVVDNQGQPYYICEACEGDIQSQSSREE